MDSIYWFVGTSHIPCVDTSVWFSTYHTNGWSVYRYELLRRTMHQTTKNQVVSSFKVFLETLYKYEIYSIQKAFILKNLVSLEKILFDIIVMVLIFMKSLKKMGLFFPDSLTSLLVCGTYSVWDIFLGVTPRKQSMFVVPASVLVTEWKYIYRGQPIGP